MDTKSHLISGFHNIQARMAQVSPLDLSENALFDFLAEIKDDVDRAFAKRRLAKNEALEAEAAEIRVRLDPR